MPFSHGGRFFLDVWWTRGGARRAESVQSVTVVSVSVSPDRPKAERCCFRPSKRVWFRGRAEVNICVCVCVCDVSLLLSPSVHRRKIMQMSQRHKKIETASWGKRTIVPFFFSLRPKLSPPLSFIVPSFISLHSLWRPCSSDLKRQHILHNRKNLKLRLRKLWLYLCASPPTSPMSESQACMIEMRAFTEQVRKTVVLRASFKGSISTRAACHCTFFVLFFCVCVCGVV